MNVYFVLGLVYLIVMFATVIGFCFLFSINKGEPVTEDYLKVCDLCGNIFLDFEDIHMGHEEDCPEDEECQCDLQYHAKCCPKCYPEGDFSQEPVYD